ncbi:MAG: hypothetical protein M3239_07500 [Thermoproteota archaeon]|nr:hypothetical protein [Thermoproteota archaeon]
MAEERSAASTYIVDLGSNIIEKLDGSPSVFHSMERHYSVSRLAEVIIHFFWKAKLEIH